MNTVKVWQSDIGLRVERYTEGRNVRGLAWERAPGVWRCFRGDFKVTPEGTAPGETGWLCIGFRDEHFTSLRGAVYWLTEGFDAPPR